RAARERGNWGCRSGLPTKDAVLAQKRAWRDRAQTGPSMRSASVSEDKRWIMGQYRGSGAPSLTSSAALLKGSFEYRQRPSFTVNAGRIVDCTQGLPLRPFNRDAEPPSVSPIASRRASCED